MAEVIGLTNSDGEVGASTSLRATAVGDWPTLACRTNLRQLDRPCNRHTRLLRPRQRQKCSLKWERRTLCQALPPRSYSEGVSFTNMPPWAPRRVFFGKRARSPATTFMSSVT